MTFPSFSPALPIDAVLAELSQSLLSHSQLILSAPPGAGKSTRLPLFLLQSLLQQKQQGQKPLIKGQIILLEPRRLAARNIAHYLAKQLAEPIGKTIGLKMRGEDLSSSQTRLLVVTEGILTRMIQADPELSQVGMIIFDEFHERSIHADLGLALALEVQQVFNENLKLMLMSATLNNEALSQLLPQAKLLSSEGRSYPVETFYQPLQRQQSLEQAISALCMTLLKQEQGSILVFLPGQREIHKTQSAIIQQLQNARFDEQVEVLPLYGRLAFSQQQKAIQPSPKGQRKIVLATNVAETSLTIEGVRIVIDSGLERRANFHIKSGISELSRFSISRASAEQRRGRAGRIEAGLCYRLWSESRSLAEHAPAQISVSDLSSLLLELAVWGEADVEQYQWLDQPPEAAVQQAKNSLSYFGALDKKGQLTEHGKALHRLGANLRTSQLILTAQKWQQDEAVQQKWELKGNVKDSGLLSLAIDLAVLLEEGLDKHAGIDLLQALPLVQQQPKLRQLAQLWLNKLHIKRSAYSPLWAAPLLAQAYPDRIAMARDSKGGRFLLSGLASQSQEHSHKHQHYSIPAVGAYIHESEALAQQAFIIAPLLMGNKSSPRAEVQVLGAVAIEEAELRAHCSHLIEEYEHICFDANKQRVVSEQQERLAHLVISRRAQGAKDQNLIRQALIQGIRQQGPSCLFAEAEVQALLARLHCAREWMSDEAWFKVDESALLDDLEQWLSPYLNGLTTLSEVRKLDIKEILLNRLDWALQQKLASQLPEVYHSPAGGRANIRYRLGQQPICSVRIQQVYGLEESPKVANGTVNVLLELLSPAQRPIQLTGDLKQFWQGSYQAVKKEMKGRYPKHFWPDNPAQAKPTMKVKSRSDTSET